MDVSFFFLQNSDMDKQKTTLLDAYVRKAIALGKLSVIENLENNQKTSAAVNIDAFNELYNDISMFIDPTDLKVLPRFLLSVSYIYILYEILYSQVIYIALWHAYINGHFGRMTKILQKLYEEKYQREILEELQLVVKELKWDHVHDALQKIAITSNPGSYRPF